MLELQARPLAHLAFIGKLGIRTLVLMLAQQVFSPLSYLSSPDSAFFFIKRTRVLTAD